MEFIWNSSRILIRILVASLCIQQFRWLSNSSRIKWLRNSCEILPGFDRNSSRTTWPWNSYEILQGFWSEFWWPQKFQKDFDQNSFQDLNDHGILQGIQMATEFFKDFDKNYFQELDDHWILMKFFEDFDQNSGSQH